jgi:hypothetical protein
MRGCFDLPGFADHFFAQDAMRERLGFLSQALGLLASRSSIDLACLKRRCCMTQPGSGGS